ncbi:ATP-binding protein [Streptomyces canus]|uniref:ATP-binding protein n=1 Tax=Streptomyces canus TaxID=58343 RepID=UPI0032554A4C
MNSTTSPAETNAYTERLPRAAESARPARQLVTNALNSWHLTQVSDDAVLIISELVANAVRHAKAEPIRVTVKRVNSQQVRLEVSDRSRSMPYLRVPRPNDIGGRGLPMVDALCERWGTNLYPWGKCVWAELKASDDQ